MKLISNNEGESNDDVDKLKLNNDEFDKEKKLRKKKRKGIQRRNLIDTLCESNIYQHCF